MTIYHLGEVGDVVKQGNVYFVVVFAFRENPLITLINPLTNQVSKISSEDLQYTGTTLDSFHEGGSLFIKTAKGYLINVTNQCVVNG